jgi:hypothetical protein
MYVYVCVCIYMYIYTYIYIFTHLLIGGGVVGDGGEGGRSMQLRQVGPESLLARTLMASLSDALRPLSTRQHTSAYASLSHAVKQPCSERQRQYTGSSLLQEEEHATEAVGGGGCGGGGYDSAAGGGAARQSREQCEPQYTDKRGLEGGQEGGQEGGRESTQAACRSLVRCR